MLYRVGFYVHHKKQRMDRNVKVPNGVAPGDEGTQLNIREALAFDLDCGERGISLLSVVEMEGKSPKSWAAPLDQSTLAATGVQEQLPPKKVPPTKEMLLDPNLKKVDLVGLCEQWPIPQDKVDRNQNRDKLAEAIVAYFYPEVTPNPSAGGTAAT